MLDDEISIYLFIPISYDFRQIALHDLSMQRKYTYEMKLIYLANGNGNSSHRARRQLGHSSPSSVLRLCDRAGAALSESLQQSTYRQPNSMVQVSYGES